MAGGFRIGEAAAAVGLNAKTIRYYEELGLLGEPTRTASGYRMYAECDLERLRFIAGAKSLGLSLNEIKEILGVWSAGERPCARVSQLLSAKLTELDRRIVELRRFRDALAEYKLRVDERTAGSDVPCAHVAGVTAGEWQPPSEHPAEPLSRTRCASDKNTGPLRLVPPRP